MKEYLYMAVTNDEYQLPVAVGETVQGLADVLGVKKATVAKVLHRNGTNVKRTLKYIKVEFDGEEEKPKAIYKKWTEKEEEYLKEKYGKYDLQKISRRLKRTNKAIKEKIKQLKLGKAAEATEYMTASELGECLGRSKSTIARWIEGKGLPAERKNITINKEIYRIDTIKFWKWCKNNLNLMRWELYQRNSLGEEPKWLDKEIKKYHKNKAKNATKDWTDTQDELLRHYYNQGLKTKEIAELLGRTESSIYSRVNVIQAKKKKVNIPWKDIEIETLLSMREKKISYETIAEELGREVACVTVKYSRLKKQMQA